MEMVKNIYKAQVANAAKHCYRFGLGGVTFVVIMFFFFSCNEDEKILRKYNEITLQDYIIESFKNDVFKSYSEKELCIFNYLVKHKLVDDNTPVYCFNDFQIYHFTCEPYLYLNFHLIISPNGKLYTLFEKDFKTEYNMYSEVVGKALLKSNKINLLRLDSSKETATLNNIINSDDFFLNQKSYTNLNEELILSSVASFIYEVYKSSFLNWTGVSNYQLITKSNEMHEILYEQSIKCNGNEYGDTTNNFEEISAIISSVFSDGEVKMKRKLILYDKQSGFLIYKISYNKIGSKFHFNLKKEIIPNICLEVNYSNDINYDHLFKNCN